MIRGTTRGMDLGIILIGGGHILPGAGEESIIQTGDIIIGVTIITGITEEDITIIGIHTDHTAITPQEEDIMPEDGRLHQEEELHIQEEIILVIQGGLHQEDILATQG